MAFKDFTHTRRVVMDLKSDSDFGIFLQKTAELIDELALFYFVGLKITDSGELTCPSCLVTPDRIDVVEMNITNTAIHQDYHVDIQFVVRHPNESILGQQVLGLEQAVRRKLRRGDDKLIRIFAEVAGHFDTQLQTTNIKPVAELSKGIFLFSSGLN